MGYYYRFETKPIKLRRDTPKEVIDFLAYEISRVNEPAKKVPDHPLFKLKRWDALFSQHPHKKTYFKDHVLKIQCSINYGLYEIEQFTDWIAPYVSGHKPKEFIGQMKGEEGPLINVYITRESRHSTNNKATIENA